jgi:pentose-5-phosphate-3-epimerase
MFLLVVTRFRDPLDLSHFDVLDHFIASLTLFIPVTFAATGGCKRGLFTFVSPEI